MKKIFLILIFVLSILISGCATAPDDIAASSVSALQFKNHDCDDITKEFERISRNLNMLYHQLNKKASDDSAQMAVGLILFFPALFFLEGGDGPQAQQYAQLKGEFQALEKVAISKKCDISIPEMPTNKKVENNQDEAQ